MYVLLLCSDGFNMLVVDLSGLLCILSCKLAVVRSLANWIAMVSMLCVWGVVNICLTTHPKMLTQYTRMTLCRRTHNGWMDAVASVCSLNVDHCNPDTSVDAEDSVDCFESIGVRLERWDLLLAHLT